MESDAMTLLERARSMMRLKPSEADGWDDAGTRPQEKKSAMVKAVWNGTVLAESDKTIMVEGNHYFPPESVRAEYMVESDRHTTCPWKGLASYYHVSVGGETNKDAAWYYPAPKAAAQQITGYVAFWKGVRVG